MNSTETSKTAIPVTIQPKNVYGLRTDVQGNIHFSQKQEVIYPVEGVLCFHDYLTNKQKFLRFPEKINPQIIAMSPNKKFIAILERLEAETKDLSNVVIYDALTLKKRRTVPVPTTAKSNQMTAISFTGDSRALVLLSKPPEETIFLCLFDKAETVIQNRVANTNMRGEAQCFACNPYEAGSIVVGGDNVFKILSKNEKGFNMNQVKCEYDTITSVAWLAMDMLVAGTQRGELIFVEAGEAKQIFDAQSTDSITISHDTETGEELANESNTQSSVSVRKLSTIKSPGGFDERVMCLTSFPRGFAYAIFRTVYVYQVGDTKSKYKRQTIVRIDLQMYPEPLYQIMNLAVNSQQDTLIVTARHSQIYTGPLFVPETLNAKELHFDTLGESLHIDSIVDLSVCAWKPIVMTASKDQTIRIWNYETERIELVKKYQVDVAVVELHPTGLLAAAGFSDQLRLLEILLDDLLTIKTYNLSQCRDVIFSHFGHKMAVAHNNLLTIISVFTFDILFTLKGHNDTILTLAFSHDDRYLFSGGEDGAVYQWDMETGTRVHEVVQKGIAYNCLTTSSDPLFAYAVTNTGLLREIGDSQIHREVKPQNVDVALQFLAMSRSNLVMFMASDQGHLFNVQLPFMEAGGGTCTNYRFFHGNITRMRISYDDTLLVTASSQGTLAIWAILNNENRIASLDRDLGKCGEILISRKMLMDRLETIRSLELRMQQQADEFTYQKRRYEKFLNDTVAQIQREHQAEMGELKQNMESMENSHKEQLNLITWKIAQSKEEHQRALQDLETECHNKIIIEYDKSTSLRTTMDEMRHDYEDKLKQSAENLRNTVTSLESDFKRKLHERQDLIQHLTQEMENKKQEFEEYCRQVETDNDRHLVDTQLTYEKKLKAEQEATLKWRGKAGVLKKKHDTLSKDNEELREEIEALKDAHGKHQKTIAIYTQDIEGLRHEIDERDTTIGEKEKRIQELTLKNQELEKLKLLLNYKISELKSEIEPRERHIKEKRNQIVEMERELEGLKQNNMQLDLQLNELKDKQRAAEIEIETERQRVRQTRNYISRICADIYQISRVTDPRELAEEMKKLYHKYSDSEELKRAISSDAQVEGEFQRQRNYLEKVNAACNANAGRKTQSIALTKLTKENLSLLDTINELRTELQLSQERMRAMERFLGVGSVAGQKKAPPIAREKLEKALKNIEDIETQYRSEVSQLHQQIEILTIEKENLKTKINEQITLKQQKKDNVQ